MYEAIAPNLTIKITPIDPFATFRNPYTLIENYAGLLKTGQGEVSSEKEGAPEEFQANDWRNQTAFKLVIGDLDFVRFTRQGRVMRGISAAADSRPDRELCGLTIELRTERLWNHIDEDVSVNFPPRLPDDAKKLKWKSKKGQFWETWLPTMADAVSMLRYRDAPANATVAVVTDQPLDKDQGFEMTLNFGGVAYNHEGDPALRVKWGDAMSIVFRGKGAKAFPQVELRRDGEWNVRMVLNEGKSMTDEFWKASHKLRVYRLAGKCVVELDGVGYYFTTLEPVGAGVKPVGASWPKARVEISIVGADVMFSLAKLTGKEENGGFCWAEFYRALSAPQRLDQGVVFTATGDRPCRLMSTISQLIGFQLDQIEMAGHYWEMGYLDYRVTMTCDETSAPLLCCYATHFPVSPLVRPLPDVEIRDAVSEWQVDSGDPEDSQASEATFTVSRELLKQVCAVQEPPIDWRDVLAPFRPVKIGIQTSPYPEDEEILFSGWIKPNNYEVNDSADQTFSVVCGDVISERLNEHAGLIDERFAPLDMAMEDDRRALWVGDCVQFIIGVILGPEAAARFNGEGNALKYYAPGAPAILDRRPGAAGLNILGDLPQKANFYFPPPFGDSAIAWIQKLAENDFGVIFYEPRSDAVYYGDINEFLFEREATVHNAYDATISRLSNQGEFDRSYNDIRVWGRAPSEGAEAFLPSLIMGRAGDDGKFSLEPTSRAQSWTRTRLIKPELLQDSFLNSDSLQATAYIAWLENAGAAPEKFTVQFDTGYIGVRWGEMIKFAAPDDTYTEFTELPNRRITKVVHRGNRAGSGDSRFSTTIEARSLSNSGR